MSRLEELIQQYCPDGVEWKPLGEVCKKVFAGGTPTSSNGAYYDGDIPWLRSGEVNFNEIKHTEKTITEEGYNSSSAKWIEKHSVLIAMTGATVARSAMAMIDLTANQSVCALIPKRDILYYRFLYYWISKSYLQLKGMAQGALTSLNLNIIKNLEIPVPPLPVQEEIVRILDTFTELQAELQAELQKRLQQYNYYRDNLLSFEGRTDVEWKKLGDVCDFMNGKGHEKSIVEKGKYIVVNSKFISTQGGVRKYSDEQISPLFVGDVLMVMSDLPNGRALAKCFIVDKDNLYTLNQRICSLKVKKQKELSSKYLFYITNRNRQLLRFDNGVDQTNLRKDDILNILIPVPPITEQQRIVGVLDRFDTLVNDISQGLPAEIEARRKQYEYYRDQLLTFKQKA